MDFIKAFKCIAPFFGKFDDVFKSISVIPGHGPETDIATERMTNPFLLPFNEPYEE